MAPLTRLSLSLVCLTVAARSIAASNHGLLARKRVANITRERCLQVGGPPLITPSRTGIIPRAVSPSNPNMYLKVSCAPPIWGQRRHEQRKKQKKHALTPRKKAKKKHAFFALKNRWKIAEKALKKQKNNKNITEKYQRNNREVTKKCQKKITKNIEK